MRHRDGHQQTRRSPRRVLERVLLAGVLISLLFCGWWRLTGGSWREVESPSMGTVAPVGSLLWVKPVAYADLKPGDFITFHPPGRPDETFSHQVYRIDASGIMTKGVIPAPDPWHLHAADLVGRVTTVWWGVGWIVVAMPVLLIGGLVTAFVRTLARERWRLPATILLVSLTLTIAITWVRPFVNAEQLSVRRGGPGGGAPYVGPGLRPVRMTAADPPDAARPDGTAVMRDGQVGTVVVTKIGVDGKLRVSLGPAIPLWWWLILVGVCFVPAIGTLVVGQPATCAHRGESRFGREPRARLGWRRVVEDWRTRPAGGRAGAHSRA